MLPPLLLSLRNAIGLLRISLAIVFLAHAITRVVLPGSVREFSLYLNEKGFVYGTSIVWLITIFEISGGIFLALKIRVKQVAAAFIALLIAGIIIIHFKLGWFVGEHGTGGCEYSFILIISLLVVAAAESEKVVAERPADIR